MPDDELLEEKSAISGLRFTGERRQEARSVVDSYTFPFQECDLKKEDKLKTGDGGSLGTVISIDIISRRIEIKKGPTKSEIHPTSVFVHSMVDDKVKEEAIFRIATWVVRNRIDAEGPYRAGRDLLLNQIPHTKPDFKSECSAQENTIAWVQALDNGVLPIQGPPGSGKSHTAANMILALIRSGKKVGITALSHKVIIGLMQKVVKFANEQSISVQCIRKVSTVSKVPEQQIEEVTGYDKIVAALESNAVNVVGGTPWLWAREEMAEAVDVLFVDEAGQLSLIDTVAVSQAAKNIVLLGDPQQLKQPQQSSHPEGTELSALEHILRDHRTSESAKTIPPGKGIFLDQTWRLHPNICAFISELFYESKLHPRSNLVNQAINDDTRFSGSGLWFQPVYHKGNQNRSVEEADIVSTIVRELTKGDVFFTDGEKVKSVLSERNILVIAPYNAQVALLSSKLPGNIQIGTVDKFQGQEAPVVIFSMATSSPEDAPRGMEFLYSLNRLNVAVSRAKATFILVANPQLFEPDCKNVEQMKLANAFCRYLEMANG